MPRTARTAPGGMVFHVLNRGVGKNQIFFNDGDYLAFERVIAETLDKRPMRIMGYCLMPNHWHFVLLPEKDGDLAGFMQRLTVTQVTRWQRTITRLVSAMCIKVVSSHFRLKGMSIFIRSIDTTSATPYERTWSSERRIGRLAAFGFDNTGPLTTLRCFRARPRLVRENGCPCVALTALQPDRRHCF